MEASRIMICRTIRGIYLIPRMDFTKSDFESAHAMMRDNTDGL